MKKSLSLFIIAFIALTSSINANAWTDRNTFGLKGPVKAVVSKCSKGHISEFDVSYKIEFEENGNFIFSEDWLKDWVNRDEEGKLIRIGTFGDFTEFGYSSSGKISTLKHYTGIGGFIYTYNSKDQTIRFDFDGESANAKDFGFPLYATYTYQKFDKYGNWIKRTAKTGKKRTVETRTITYYE